MTEQEKGTDATSRRLLAYLAATPYWFSERLGDAQIGSSTDGREIAIYFDDATQEYYASTASAWRRMIDEEIDYSEWCSSTDAIEVFLNEDDIFDGGTDPEMNDRDRLWRMVEDSRYMIFLWLHGQHDPTTDPKLGFVRRVVRELERALCAMREMSYVKDGKR